MDPRAQREVWERIAPSWSAARAKPWPIVEQFLDRLPRGARVADVGAGGGRHTRAARARGLDATPIDAARAFRPDVRALAEALPLRDASVDAVLLVAVLGTLPRRDDRVAALREARRVLRPEGWLLCTMWASGQPKHLRAQLGLGPWRRAGPSQVWAPWVAGGARVDRLYYLYSAGELRADLAAAGWAAARPEPATLAARWRDNWVVRARKAGEA
ncbi:MAG TPA: class I SAM-dependent methyltransferase [Candidatus Thermoplasmatota archaeon]|nr:class I SAM-dependent methyltransferase [Candidatus Thermoplasmatota archaeon]